MKIALLAGLLTIGAAASSPLFAQETASEVDELKQRVERLEKQVEELSRFLEPLKAQQSSENRRKALREKFQQKMDQDRKNYSQEQLREAERLYQVANQKWGTPEATESLQTMIQKYPDINRTGCALLYIAQKSQGDDRVKYLRDCMEKYGDCYYGDGVQVGAYARFLLAQDYIAQGDQAHASTLLNELRTNYADAIDHHGGLLLDAMKVDVKQDQAGLQGTWEVTEFIMNGNSVSEDDRKDLRFVFEGDVMKLTGPGGIGKREYKYQLDPLSTPKSIDTIPQDGPFQGKSGPAIYELQGDVLKLCIPNKETSVRPKEFHSPQGSNLGLFVLKRAQP